MNARDWIYDKVEHTWWGLLIATVLVVGMVACGFAFVGWEMGR